ncbi:MAG TPA: hypothetical protein VFF61_13225, partial [Microvirga sp.]|nr:hypothetical protein [Microvirga sp.]
IAGLVGTALLFEQNRKLQAQTELLSQQNEKLALQLRSSFDVGFSGFGLMGSSPERPGDNVSRPDAALGKPHRHAPDLLY